MPESQSTRRLHVLLWVLLAWGGAIFVRLILLQVVHHDDLLRMAQQQQQKMREIPAMRGSIFDRNGQPLAKSIPGESVCVNPQKIKDAGMAAEILARSLDLDRDKLYGRIQGAMLRGSGFLWIKRKIAADEAERLRSLKLDWVEFRPEILRFYPHHELAAHVVGFMGITDPDDTDEHGVAGVESSFDEDLSGRPGLSRVYTDVRQDPYDQVVARAPDPGANLTLTIDSNLQYEAEKDLEKAVKSSNAKSGSIVAMNPYTGEVLALANYPTYDPNDAPSSQEEEGARSDLAVQTPFEPGSVFKTVTLSAALETTRLTPETIIDCHNGVFNLYGRIIHDAGHHGLLTMQEVFEKSSNIGAIQIGMKVGDREMYEYVRKFGFGRKTGIELPGESAGMVRRVEQWQPTSIGSVAMGHEVSTTSIQLAVGAAAIANGGMLVKPTILLARQKPGESEERFHADPPTRVLKPETAIQMREFMEGVVLRGTGKNLANLKGYTSGGKTGTAQVYDFKAHVYTHRYNASFVGFAPVTNPQIVVAVTINDTSGGTAGYGGPVAAPVFRDIATTALRILDVPKDLPDTDVVLTSSSRNKADADGDDLAIAGLGEPPADDLDARGGDPARIQAVSSSTPSPPVSADSEVPASGAAVDRRFFSAGDQVVPAALAGPKVPSFRGMTLRQVLEESSATGLPVEVGGAVTLGLVRAQDPPAGEILEPGKSIRVEFVK